MPRMRKQSSAILAHLKSERLRNETWEVREARLKANAQRMSIARSLESDVQRQNRLEANAQRMSTYRSNESEARRLARLEANAKRMSISRSLESEEQRQARLEANAQRMFIARAIESEAERCARLAANARRMAITRSIEFDNQQRLHFQAIAQQMLTLPPVEASAFQSTLRIFSNNDEVANNNLCKTEPTAISINLDKLNNSSEADSCRRGSGTATNPLEDLKEPCDSSH